MDKRIEKIIKIKAQAEDPSVTLAEAEHYARYAAKLMAKNGITEDMIDAARGETGDITQKVITLTCAYPEQMAMLIGDIADAIHCRVLHVRKLDGRHDHKVVIIGAKRDFERVQELSRLIIIQALRALEEEPVPPSEWSMDGFRKNYLRGYGQRIGARLRSIEDRAVRAYDRETAAAPGAASAELVVRDKKERLDEFMEQEYPDLPMTPDAPLPFSGGYLQGSRSADHADVGLSTVEG